MIAVDNNLPCLSCYSHASYLGKNKSALQYSIFFLVSTNIIFGVRVILNISTNYVE